MPKVRYRLVGVPTLRQQPNGIHLHPNKYGDAHTTPEIISLLLQAKIKTSGVDLQTTLASQQSHGSLTALTMPPGPEYTTGVLIQMIGRKGP